MSKAAQKRSVISGKVGRPLSQGSDKVSKPKPAGSKMARKLKRSREKAGL